MQRARYAAHRTQCKNNLKQIAMALESYADYYGSLPPSYTVDANGKPLHSWRTLILPYLDQRALYDKIDLGKAWDDPANFEAFTTIPYSYLCPSATQPPNYTGYLGIVGENACFHPTEPRALADITDSKAETLMVFEVTQEQAVHWMAPLDTSEMMVLRFKSDGKDGHNGGTQVALADGDVRFISDNLSLETLRAMISIAGNDKARDF